MITTNGEPLSRSAVGEPECRSAVGEPQSRSAVGAVAPLLHGSGGERRHPASKRDNVVSSFLVAECPIRRAAGKVATHRAWQCRDIVVPGWDQAAFAACVHLNN